LRSTQSAPPPTSPPSLHDALPIYERRRSTVHVCPGCEGVAQLGIPREVREQAQLDLRVVRAEDHLAGGSDEGAADGLAHLAPYRSEEHTSELQSRFDLVCRLLLEK